MDTEWKDDAFKRQWDIEEEQLLQKLKERKLSYLYTIFGGEGCLKVKEFVEKDRKNPFFKFLDETNYDEMERDAARLSLGEFVTKHGTP